MKIQNNKSEKRVESKKGESRVSRKKKDQLDLLIENKRKEINKNKDLKKVKKKQ